MNPSLLIGSTAVLGALLALWWAVSGARPARAGVNLGGTRQSPTRDLHTAVLQRSVSERTFEPLVGRLAKLGRRYTPSGRITGLEQRLLLAGAPRGWTLERILAIKALSVLGGIALTALILLSGPSLLPLLLTGAGTALVFFTPDLILHSRADDRRQVIHRALADTVDQLTVSVQAGLGLDAAIARAAVTTEGPLSSEFARVTQDMRAGMRRSDALLAMSERVGLPELRQVVLALTQAEKLGVPVAQTMRIQAEQLRLKRSQAAEEKAMKLPVKIVFPTALCILPSLFIVILGPAAINIYETLIKG